VPAGVVGWGGRQWGRRGGGFGGGLCEVRQAVAPDVCCLGYGILWGPAAPEASLIRQLLGC
jgi:hypothetical protein